MAQDKKKPLKLVEFTINDEQGSVFGDLNLISIVKDPAIQRSFHLFSKEKKQQFAKIEDKQIIVGAVMTPNKPILRFDDKTNEYYNCFFSEDTVRKCSQLFFKNSNHTHTSLEHSEIMSSNQIEGAYVVESWVCMDPLKDLSSYYGLTASKGDWFCSFKIEDPKLWSIIKENGFTGFSVEGVFGEKFNTTFKEIGLESEIKRILYNEQLSDKDKEGEIKKVLFK